MSTKRTFIAEVETVYHKDYQCDYYRGVIIDGENKIVERCKEMHPTYDEALWDAQKKYMQSPLYSKQASSELKEKYEAYKKAKEEADRLETVFIYDPGEWNCWEYMYDHGLYRFRYVNQNESAALTGMRLSQTLIGQVLSVAYGRAGESDRAFYMSRVRSIDDIMNLPGHKDIWEINKVLDIRQKKNGDARVTIQYRKYGNLRDDFRNREHKKTISVKQKWSCFNELMDWFRQFP